MAFDTFKYEGTFTLESGAQLTGYHLGYTTYGALNEAKDNVVWIFHALTANSDPAEWWPSLVGTGKCFDPVKDFIVCVNMPGSCYGSIGPLEINEATGRKFYHDFPFFTTRDMIRSYKPLLRHLGIDKIKAGVGGSMGGQQLLEWAIEDPELFENIFPLATNAIHSPWGRAFNASQRFCIENDPTWKECADEAGIEGMKIARSIALLSYRHYETYEKTQSDPDDNTLLSYRSESYQKYQGEKLARRFNAFSYYLLSQGMDAHNVGRGRGSIEAALQRIKARTFVMGIETDVLFPVSEQQFLAAHIPGADFHLIKSFYGHDGFLLEYEQIGGVINRALASFR
ncbi:MAG TPA: homoserine O-acetyltransferase [Ginsengibacter sp.]|nr:homoserine O-acetyltransferase [Ginsengibacter sp.]HRP16784.1 homoserine O-acetyltransferase [Ginsengibacter sp.]HRP43489.1 homoserine O-acetyltransferase [Ginsengibacter sp.]